MSPSKDDSASSSFAPKIAIKGFSLSSKPNTSKPKSGARQPQLQSTLGKRRRSTFQAGDDSGDDSENGDTHEVVTGFGEGGAIRKKDEREMKEKGELVIQSLGNKDWRGEMRAKKAKSAKNLLPPEVQREREAAKNKNKNIVNGKKGDVNSGKEEIKWGLTVRKRENGGKLEGDSEKVEDLDMGESDEPPPEEENPRTADEEALAALLGDQKEKKGPDLIILTLDATLEDPPQPSTEDAYRRAIASAPDVSTLEDYERVPVEEFGAALLRGMGWKGEKIGQVRDVKRRQNLLGLGAKELKDAEELGAWVQKSDTKRLNGGEKRGGGSRSGGGSGDRRPKVSEYKREKEKRDERREERGGGGYRRERERERERDSGRDRDRYRERESDKDRRR